MGVGALGRPLGFDRFPFAVGAPFECPIRREAALAKILSRSELARAA